MDTSTIAERPSLKITRHYPIAPEKIWRAWTDAQTLKRWFAPNPEEVVRLAETDLRVGGRYRIAFGKPGGEEHDVSGVYQEVVTNRKVVFTWAWKSTPERESLVTITLEPAGKGTDLVFLHERFFDQTARDNHEKGWSMLFDKFGGFLAAD